MNAQKVYVIVGHNGILKGLIMGVCSTREKAEQWIENNMWQMEPTPTPTINEIIIDEADGNIKQEVA